MQLTSQQRCPDIAKLDMLSLYRCA